MKISKRQLKRLIREEKSRLLEGYKEERAMAAATAKRNPKPNPQFPKMTYPEDRAKAAADKGDLYVNLTDEQASALDNLEAAAAACSKAGCTRADVMDTISGFNLK
jgi:hypothetical protein